MKYLGRTKPASHQFKFEEPAQPMFQGYERIQKALARLGIASRREIESWIQVGRINVNGRIAMLGDSIKPTDRIAVDGREVFLSQASSAIRVLLYNKPEGQVCTLRDPEGRPTVFRKLPRLTNSRWINVGRLDINTRGLLLLTTDGELAYRLMSRTYSIEREYAVRVLGEVTGQMVDNLLKGVELIDGTAKFTHLEFAGGEGANKWFHVVVEEGRHRIVRRLWESQGLSVSRLIRVRFGEVRLPRSLPCGRYREFAPNEVSALAHSVGMDINNYQAAAHGYTRRSNIFRRRRSGGTGSERGEFI